MMLRSWIVCLLITTHAFAVPVDEKSVDRMVGTTQIVMKGFDEPQMNSIEQVVLASQRVLKVAYRDLEPYTDIEKPIEFERAKGLVGNAVKMSVAQFRDLVYKVANTRRLFFDADRYGVGVNTFAFEDGVLISGHYFRSLVLSSWKMTEAMVYLHTRDHDVTYGTMEYLSRLMSKYGKIKDKTGLQSWDWRAKHGIRLRNNYARSDESETLIDNAPFSGNVFDEYSYGLFDPESRRVLKPRYHK